MNPDLHSDLAKLEAALAQSYHDNAALRKDKERLDCLETLARIESGNCDKWSASHYMLCFPSGKDYYRPSYDKPFRTAIDAAMSAEGKSL
jgi:hypothetical protein